MADSPSSNTRSSLSVNAEKANKSQQDLISGVISDLISNENFLSLVGTAVEKRLAELASAVETLQGQVLDLESSAREKEKKFKSLQEEVCKQSVTIQSLQRAANDQEQYSRRNCLRFTGLEESAKENTDEVVLHLANTILQVPITKDDIERSYRVGMKDREPTSGGRRPLPRPIIVTFSSYGKRQQIIQNRRKLAGQRKSIQEDLTRTNADLLKQAKTCSKVKVAWTTDGRVIALTETGDKKGINSAEDLRRLR